MMMEAQQLREELGRLEETIDAARKAIQAGRAPASVHDCVERLHRQARDAKQEGGRDEQSLRHTAMQLEEGADEAMRACQAATALDPGVLQAVQRVHGQASKLKHRLETA